MKHFDIGRKEKALKLISKENSQMLVQSFNCCNKLTVEKINVRKEDDEPEKKGESDIYEKMRDNDILKEITGKTGLKGVGGDKLKGKEDPPAKILIEENKEKIARTKEIKKTDNKKIEKQEMKKKKMKCKKVESREEEICNGIEEEGKNENKKEKASDENKKDKINNGIEKKNMVDDELGEATKRRRVQENGEDEEFYLAAPFYYNNSQFAFTDEIDVREYRIPKNRPVRIYCDGVYDLFHYGHMRSLMQAKNLFKNVFLLVGVTNDNLTLKNKGSLVFDENERIESLKHCRYVDEVIENAPWKISDKFLETHYIDYVCHDNLPYSSGENADVYHHLKRNDKFIPTRRTSGISTTKIITKIVKDYDLFVRRQLERGINAEELNLSFFRKESINVKNTIRNIELDVKKEISEIKTELRLALIYWEKLSNEMIKNFSEKFVQGADEQSLFKKILKKIVLMIERRRKK